MFYSHTFLAKKSPLGTVWIAAHLQSKLRKSHVTVTDIPSTVDCIIFPEVPIALRLSGHLLLGIVRIYSKKVDYLFHDCNDVLSQMRIMFASVHVNLPDDADRATFQAVTLPESFNLDALEIDPIYEAPDRHLKTYEQITLPDQMPLDQEQFVAFNINEERFDSPLQPESKKRRTLQTDENIPDPNPDSLPTNEAIVESTPSPIANARVLTGSVSSEENLRHVEADLVLPSEADQLENAICGNGENNSPSPSPGLLPLPIENSLPLSRRNSPAVLPQDAQESGHEGRPFEVELELAPQDRRERKRSREREYFFDLELVIPNREMKKQLKDTKGLVRKRQKLPFLKSKTENFFDRPLFPGMCADLKKRLERPVPKKVNAHDMDAETMRANVSDMEVLPESTPSVVEREEPASVHLGDSSVEKTAISTEPEIHLSPSHALSEQRRELNLSPSHEYSEMRPEFSPPNSAEDFAFLDADSVASGGRVTTIGSMSERTRLVASFFKDQSPLSQRSTEGRSELSLTGVLQGKSRKQCARMFYETLVLKTCDLVDVSQDEAYGDIWVSLKPTLSKVNL